jgi:hypothetical protein
MGGIALSFLVSVFGIVGRFAVAKPHIITNENVCSRLVKPHAIIATAFPDGRVGGTGRDPHG